MNENFDEQLRRRLADADPLPPFPRDRIRAGVRATIEASERSTPRFRRAAGGMLMRAAAMAAAAVLLFVAGVEYGRRLVPALTEPGASDATGVGGTSSQPQATVSMSIQQRGTAYLMEVARLSETADSLTPEQLEEARQVATAILYGAALELVRAAPDDEFAAGIVRSLRAQRKGNDDERWY